MTIYASSATLNVSSFSLPSSSMSSLTKEQDEKEPLLGRVFGDGDESDRSRPSACGCCKTRRRCCLWSLLIIALVLTTSGLLAWFVFIPQFVERQMAQTKLQVDAIRMHRLQANGFRLHMEYTLADVPASMNIQAGAMDVQVFYNGTALGRLTLPPFNITQGNANISMQADTEFIISDATWFVAFASDMLQVRFAMDFG